MELDGPPPERLKLAVRLDQKINLGDYQSVDLSLMVTGITEDHTEADIDALIEAKGRIVYEKMAKRMGEMAHAARVTRGWQ